ncbi:DUF1506 family protein [Borreliella burgdorferi]|uniref:Uncharacterized protein n=5 Tax=Borreliella burgdorferi TaxID=139 RepID=O50936_BORBU|nr:DUF1506 family protein [Borreliella burgdorferi]AAC66253.1 conserved hypothetical protein [Borreliella burgdorferi B31]ACK74234.1 conserved hypothetical protein [Borreliella burgdorferi ZS7]ACL33782.1 conserved hypothetical protein [Borreliella burgdorferi 156a]ACM10086.1 conserved hypothetical protein [Borreliella burgdorferi 72a]ACN24289.1 conserved hypothetical protein [Borreliella burgdorferi 64b]
MKSLEMINISLSNIISIYSQELFFCKFRVIKDPINASYETRFKSSDTVVFKGMFLLINPEEVVEIEGVNIFDQNSYAKVYTLENLEFEYGDLVKIFDDVYSILGVQKSYKEGLNYNTLVLRSSC